MKSDLYSELRVPPDVTPEELKKAYRKRARATHPDKGGKTGDFQAVNKAYQVLSDPARRKAYDETGSTEEEASTATLFQNLVIAAAERINDPAHQNVLKEAARMIDDGCQNAAMQIRKLQSEQKKWEQIGKRLRKKGAKDSPVLALIAQRIAVAEHEIKRGENDIKQGEEMRKMLAEYEYNVDKEPQHGTTTFTSFITSKF